jgi:hypothetical protein
MDWLSKYDRVIQCARKAVRLTKKDGATVEFVAMVKPNQGNMLNQTKAMALEDIRVVQEYPDVFLEELPGMCHTPFRERGNEASIRVPRMFKSHAW